MTYRSVYKIYIYAYQFNAVNYRNRFQIMLKLFEDSKGNLNEFWLKDLKYYFWMLSERKTFTHKKKHTHRENNNSKFDAISTM